MKLLISLIAVALSAPLAVVMAAAELSDPYYHMAVLNDNIVEDGKSCAPEQWTTIRATIDQVANGGSAAVTESDSSSGFSIDSSIEVEDNEGSTRHKRHTRGLKGSSSNKKQQLHRKLPNCSNCGAHCSYVTPGCPKGGRRRRRSLQDDEASSVAAPIEDNSNSNLADCLSKIPAVDKALAALVPVFQDVEPSCANLVASTRTIECRQVTLECGIDAVSLETDTLQVAKVPLTGTTFCTGEPIAFTADTKFSEGSVTFVLENASGSYSSKDVDYEAPFAYHGNTVDMPLPVDAEYTLSIVTSYEPQHTKALSFSVIEC